jgi:two-component system phosphate regulon response regulator PhoB
MAARKKNILLVEDEADLAELVRHNMEHEGYACRVVSNGGSALTEAVAHPPDLILLDRMLPGMSGDDFITHLKRDHRVASIPVIMLTAKAEEADQLVGLGLGADDYVTKPFSMKLLLARVAAMFRRMEITSTDQELLTRGPVSLDSSRHEVSVAGSPVQLTATEFRLLRALMAANGRVLSRAYLIENTMGVGVAVTDRTIDVHVTALRKKLGKAARWLQTIRGVGYAFRESP